MNDDAVTRLHQAMKMKNPDPPPVAEDSYEEPSGDGRSAKHATFAVILEYANRNAASVGYGSMTGYPYHDPSRGIQFVFEGVHCDGWGDWGSRQVPGVDPGTNLGGLRDRLCAGKRELIREGHGNVTKIDVEPVGGGGVAAPPQGPDTGSPCGAGVGRHASLLHAHVAHLVDRRLAVIDLSLSADRSSSVVRVQAWRAARPADGQRQAITVRHAGLC